MGYYFFSTKVFLYHHPRPQVMDLLLDSVGDILIGSKVVTGVVENTVSFLDFTRQLVEEDHEEEGWENECLERGQM